MEEIKKRVRKAMLTRRLEIHEALVKRSEEYYHMLEMRTLKAVLRHMPVNPASETIVSGFYPINSEIDCAFLLRSLISLGFTAALPVVIGRQQPLLFRTWNGEASSLIEAPFHTKVPSLTSAECDPDVLLVPLLSFSSNKMRLGYGGGYFDRTLISLRGKKQICAIGLCYSGQYLEETPYCDTDQPLDIVVTEEGEWTLPRS